MDHRRLASAGALAISLFGVGTVLASSQDGSAPAPPVAAVPFVPAPAPEAPPFLPAPPDAALVVPEPEPKPKARAKGGFDDAVLAEAPAAPVVRATASIAIEPTDVPAAPAPAPAPVEPLLPALAACVAEAAETTDADALAEPVAAGASYVEAWRVELDADIVGAPVLHEDCVVAVTAADRLVAVLSESGEVVADVTAPEALRVTAGTERFADAVADAAPLPELVAGGLAAEEADPAEAPAAPRAAAPAPADATATGSIDELVGHAVLLARGTVVSAPARALVGLRPAPAPVAPAPAPAPVVPPVAAAPAPEAPAAAAPPAAG